VAETTSDGRAFQVLWSRKIGAFSHTPSMCQLQSDLTDTAHRRLVALSSVTLQTESLRHATCAIIFGKLITG
jgi:hypothetical protein